MQHVGSHVSFLQVQSYKNSAKLASLYDIFSLFYIKYRIDNDKKNRFMLLTE